MSLNLLHLFNQPETPVAPRILLHRPVEIRLREIGPQHLGEPQFGVGGLPQEEIAQPLLAAGADHQIGIGPRGRVERRGESLLPISPGAISPAAARAAIRRTARTISLREE